MRGSSRSVLCCSLTPRDRKEKGEEEKTCAGESQEQTHCTPPHRIGSRRKVHTHTHAHIYIYTHTPMHAHTSIHTHTHTSTHAKRSDSRERACAAEEDKPMAPPRQRRQSRTAHRAARASRQQLHSTRRLHHRQSRSVRDASVSPHYGACRKASTRKFTRARPFNTLQSSPPSLRERRAGCLGSAGTSCTAGDS